MKSETNRVYEVLWELRGNDASRAIVDNDLIILCEAILAMKNEILSLEKELNRLKWEE